MTITSALSAPALPTTRPLAAKATVNLEPATAAPTESFEPSAPTSAPAPVALPNVDAKDLRKALGRWASGVVVVTTGEGENRFGMTASSFAAISTDPPLVMFCPANSARTLPQIEKNGNFAINMLASDQTDTCYKFAKGEHADRFAGVEAPPGPVTGAPLLKGAFAHYECQVHQIIQAGDHNIVIGRVVGLDNDTQAKPLAFWGGKPQNVQTWEPKPPAPPKK